ncbi:MAG TPA: phosphopantetheine-binding protein, partial [Pyrinomonadaceae bacterium]
VEGVGIEDNFFELGGHSLLATQVMSRVRKVFQREMELRTFFEFPTIAKFSEELDRAKTSGPTTLKRTIVAIPREAHRMKLSSLNEEKLMRDSF